MSARAPGGLPERIATAVRHEAGLIAFALTGPFRKRRDDGGFGHFGDGARTSIVAGLVMLLLFEAVPVHLVLVRHHPTLAWLLTLASAWAVLWLVGDLQALRHRRSRIEDGALRLQVGLRWSGTVPLGEIAALRTRDVARRAATRGVLRAVPKPDTPTVLLELAEPVRLAGPYGVPCTTTALALAPDERAGFVAALAAAGVPVDPA